MNLSIFWRVFWKEYRLQRSLWIAMAALTFLMQWIVIGLITSTFDKTASVYVLAVVMPSLYALGCGAILFAGEREADTHEFQRSLPVGGLVVFFGKIIFAVVSIAVLWGLTVGVAHFLNRSSAGESGWHSVVWREMIWATFGFFGLEALLWASFFSLLTKRVLPAAILGVTAASLGAQSMAMLLLASRSGTEPYVAALPWRTVIVILVALADVWLASRWFREKVQRHPRFADLAAEETATPAAAFSDRVQGPQRLAMLGRLVWQHWRQSSRIMIATMALLIPLVFTLIVWLLRALDFQPWFLRAHAGEVYRPGDKMFFFVALALALAVVPLLGINTFLADHRRSGYRFFADRGVAPKFVWLSRQLVTLGVPVFLFVSLMLGLFLLVSMLLPRPLESDLLRWTRLAEVYAEAYVLGYVVFAVLGYVILGISVGQFCSMLFRSAILAGLFSILTTGVLLAWCALMLYWQVNWLWSILPIPLALLLATRLRTADWLLERNGPRAWLRPGLALLLPAAALLIGVPFYRIHQIPLVDPGFSPAEFSRPLTAEDAATLELYRQAFSTLKPMPRADLAQHERESTAPTAAEIKWADANPKAIEAALLAGRRTIGDLPDGLPVPTREQCSDLARLLIASAAKCENDGKLDAALERYVAAIRIAMFVHKSYPVLVREYELYEDRVYGANSIETRVYAHLPAWAARPGQTPERILAAARQVEQLTADLSPRTGVMRAYLRVDRFLSGDLKAVNGAGDPNLAPPLTLLWMRLPWERERAKRLLNGRTRGELDLLKAVDERLRNNGAIEQTPPRESGLTRVGLPYVLFPTIYVPPVCYDPIASNDEIVGDYTSILTARRALRLVLALEAWKLAHRSLPKTLDELVGHGLDRLPLDPHTGRPFRYFPEGLKIPLKWNQPHMGFQSWDRDYLTGTIAAGTPLVWASGANLRYVEQSPNVCSEYRVFNRVDRLGSESYRAASEYEIWQSGWPFAVP